MGWWKDIDATGLGRVCRIAEALGFIARHGRTVRDLGLFDPDHYASAAGTRGARTWPLLHYLAIGWRKRLSPSGRADWASLHRIYPGVGLLEPMSPLEAHVRVGRFYGLEFRGAEARRALREAIRPVAWDGAPAAPVAIVVHAFYEHEFGLILAALARLDHAFDLLVTTPLDGPAVAARLAEAGLTARLVAHVPNHGRDIFPFVHLVNDGLLDRYELILKLHTKRSPHRTDGGEWFETSVGALAGPAAFPTALARFSAEPALGILTPPGMVLTTEHLEPSRWRLQALAARAGRRFREADLRFPAGSHFWARGAALRPLQRVALQADDFELESGQLDGTLAHAVERFIGLGCLHEGFRIEPIS